MDTPTLIAEKASKLLRVIVILGAYARARFRFSRLKTREQLTRWQERRIRAHLRYLQRHSPYFARMLAPIGVKNWKSLPLMSKTEMMAHFDEINTAGIRREQALSVAIEAERSRDFSPTIGKITVGLSSGTSGSRGVFMAGPLEQWVYAGTVLAKVIPGFYRRKNRLAFFLRANSNLYTSVGSRTLQFEYFDLLKPVESHVERLNRLNPTVLIAPPSLLRQLAERASARELLIQPRKIISVAEVLDPVDEARISEVFKQKIHQIYQATEGFLATTCSEGVLHLNEDVLHVEKDWLDRANRKFQPIITDFSRKTQPVIRYRLNDVLTERARPCLCGSPFTALEFIEGRSDDLFFLPAKSGSGFITVYPDFIRRSVLLASDRITDYRVLQVAADRLLAHVGLREQTQEAETQQAVRREFQNLSDTLGFAMPEIEFRNTSALGALEPGRKLRRIERQWSPTTSV